MKGFLLKIVFIIIVFIIGMVIYGVISMFIRTGLLHIGVLWLWIIAAAMFAAIGAIWRYKSASKEVELQKDEE